MRRLLTQLVLRRCIGARRLAMSPAA